MKITEKIVDFVWKSFKKIIGEILEKRKCSSGISFNAKGFRE